MKTQLLKLTPIFTSATQHTLPEMDEMTEKQQVGSWTRITEWLKWEGFYWDH